MTARTDTSVAVAEAEELVAGAAVAPRRVAGAAAALAETPGQPAEVRAVALRAGALAARGLQQPARAIDLARRSVVTARRAGLRDREAEARLTLSLALFQSGRTVTAVRQLERAATLAAGPLAMRVRVQEGILLERLGLVREAIDVYTKGLGEADVPELRARLLNNRAIARCLLGRYPGAFADFDSALRLHQAMGAEQAAAEVQHNIGFCAGLAGDVPRALVAFDAADARFRANGVPLGPNLVDRARTLLRANLVDEARAAATAAVGALDATGDAAEAAEARVLMARAQLLAGDPSAASDTARRSRRQLRAQHRWWHAAAADLVLVEADMVRGAADRRTLRRAEEAADALARLGSTLDELDCRLDAWRIAVAMGEPARAASHLDAVRARVGGGALLERSRAWYAEAEHRRSMDDHRGARRAARAGLDAVRRFQSLMGASDLRAAVGAHGRQLARLGLDLTLERGDAWQVLRWVETWRSTSLSLAPARRRDPEVEAALDELRAATRRVADGPDEQDPGAAWRSIAALEAKVVGLTRHRAGVVGERGRLLAPATARAVLGDAVLISYFPDGDGLSAVRVVDGRARLVRAVCHSRAEVATLVGESLFALRRIARPGRSEAAARTAADSAGIALDRLGGMVLDPLLRGVDPTRPLVVSPTGSLHAVPWGGLRACIAREVCSIPSLTATAGRGAGVRARGGAAGPVVVVAGPDLTGAAVEVQRVAAVHPDARSFPPERSRVADVLAAMDGAVLVHLACHGRLRADNPLFSSLKLADGPLTVHDLDALEHAPSTVVLAACAVGASAVRAGDELLGFTTALLRAGTRNVVASLLPVPDDATADLMVGLHEHLAGGCSPTDALARCRGVLGDSPLELALRAAFVSVGAR